MTARHGVRGAVIAVAMLVALVGCGPSSAQVHAARSAQYRASSAALLDATVAALRAHRYVIAGVDPVAGTVQTAPIWFSPVGTPRTTVRDGDIQFAIAARVEPGAEGAYRIVLAAAAARTVSGFHDLAPIEANDADAPGWFATRLDDVYLDVYARLRGSVVAPPPAR